MDSCDRFNTFSSRHLCNCTTSSACWRVDKPAKCAVELGLGWCKRKARLAVTARMEVQARPDSRRMAVARGASTEGSMASTSKKGWVALRSVSSEKEAK